MLNPEILSTFYSKMGQEYWPSVNFEPPCINIVRNGLDIHLRSPQQRLDKIYRHLSTHSYLQAEVRYFQNSTFLNIFRHFLMQRICVETYPSQKFSKLNNSWNFLTSLTFLHIYRHFNVEVAAGEDLIWNAGETDFTFQSLEEFHQVRHHWPPNSEDLSAVLLNLAIWKINMWNLAWFCTLCTLTGYKNYGKDPKLFKYQGFVKSDQLELSYYEIGTCS